MGAPASKAREIREVREVRQQPARRQGHQPSRLRHSWEKRALERPGNRAMPDQPLRRNRPDQEGPVNHPSLDQKRPFEQRLRPFDSRFSGRTYHFEFQRRFDLLGPSRTEYRDPLVLENQRARESSPFLRSLNGQERASFRDREQPLRERFLLLISGLRMFSSQPKEFARERSLRSRFEYFMRGLRYVAEFSRERFRMVEKEKAVRDRNVEARLKEPPLTERTLEKARETKQALKSGKKLKDAEKAKKEAKEKEGLKTFEVEIAGAKAKLVFKGEEIVAVQFEPKADAKETSLAPVLIAVGELLSSPLPGTAAEINPQTRETAESFVLESAFLALSGSGQVATSVSSSFRELSQTYHGLNQAEKEPVSWGEFVGTFFLGLMELSIAEKGTASSDPQSQMKQIVEALETAPADQRAEFFYSVYCLGKLYEILPQEAAVALTALMGSYPIENRIEALDQAVEPLSHPQNLLCFCEASRATDAAFIETMASATPNTHQGPTTGNIIDFQAEKEARRTVPCQVTSPSTSPEAEYLSVPNVVQLLISIGEHLIEIREAIERKNTVALAEALVSAIEEDFLPDCKAAERLKNSSLAKTLSKNTAQAIPLFLEAYEIIMTDSQYKEVQPAIENMAVETIVELAKISDLAETILILTTLPLTNGPSKEIITQAILRIAAGKGKETVSILVESIFTKAASTEPVAFSTLESIEGQVLQNIPDVVTLLLELYLVIMRKMEEEARKLSVIEDLLSQLPATPENLSAMLDFLRLNPEEASRLNHQIIEILFKRLFYSISAVAYELRAVSFSSLSASATPQAETRNPSGEAVAPQANSPEIPASDQVRILSIISRLLNTDLKALNDNLEKAREEMRKLYEIARAANLKLSFISFIMGYIYAGILLHANGTIKSDLIAEMDTASAQSRSSTNPRVVADINKGETGADIARGDFEAVSDSSHESAFFICGVVHRLLESQKAKAERIISVLSKNPAVWEEMLDDVENQRIEKVIDFVNNLLRTARSMVAPTAGENPHQARYIYSKPVLAAALAKVTGSANPQAAALAA